MPKIGSCNCVYIKQYERRNSEEVGERAGSDVWEAASCEDHTGENIEELSVRNNIIKEARMHTRSSNNRLKIPSYGCWFDFNSTFSTTSMNCASDFTSREFIMSYVML